MKLFQLVILAMMVWLACSWRVVLVAQALMQHLAV